MKRTLIIRLSLIALFLLLAKWGWNHVKGDDGMMMFYFVVMGVIGGSLFVKYVLPWFGDAVGTVVFSSGEEIQVNDGLKAAAKLAQGDYEGAISEHEKALHENPMQTFPAAEIAKICAQKLNDPQRGLQVLQKHLASQTWPEDDAAFLRFRMVDIQLETIKDLTQARQLLEQIIADFPNTRHSANANHKLHELEQEEYKVILAQRAKNTPQ